MYKKQEKEEKLMFYKKCKKNAEYKKYSSVNTFLVEKVLDALLSYRE